MKAERWTWQPDGTGYGCLVMADDPMTTGPSDADVEVVPAAEYDRLRVAVQNAYRGCIDEDWDYVRGELYVALHGPVDAAA